MATEEVSLLESIDLIFKDDVDFAGREINCDRIISLPKSEENSSLLLYHFIDVIDDIIYVVGSAQRSILCYCKNTGRQISTLNSGEMSTDMRGITVLPRQECQSDKIIILGDNRKKILHIFCVDKNGNKNFEDSFGSVEECCGLANNKKDQIFVADWGTKSISIYKHMNYHQINERPKFGIFRVIKHPKLSFPYCVAYHKFLITVGQPMTSSILLFSENGDFLKEYSLNETLDEQSPRDIARDECGNIIVANGRLNNILVLDKECQLMKVWQMNELFRLKTPRSIVLVEDGKMVILASVEDNHENEVLVISE